MKIREYKKIFKYILDQKFKIFIIILCMVVSQIGALIMPTIMAKIVDTGIKRYGFEVGYVAGNFLPAAEIVVHQTQYIIKMGLYMLSVSLVSIVFSVLSSYLISKVSAEISSEIRHDMFEKVLGFSARDMDKLSSSSLITRVTNDVEHVKNSLLMSVHILMPPFMIIGCTYMALVTCMNMSWIVALSSALAVGVAVTFIRMIVPKIKKMQKLNDKFNLIVRERLSGIVITRVFNNNDYEQEKFDVYNRKFSSISFFVGKITAFMTPALTVIMNLSSILVMWLGAEEIRKSSMNVGNVMAFMQYSVLTIMAFLMLSLMLSGIPKALISVDRVLEVLNVKSEDSPTVKQLGGVDAENIEFRNVYFKYEGAEEFAVKNISFSVNRGEKIGIIGSTGSGKSTIFKLILGHYRTTQGGIFINGVNINELDKKSINDNIAYIPQKPVIFSGTVESNLRLGDEHITHDEMCRALKIAQMEHLANREGLNKCVEPSGNNFSGGEKQRLALARAIVKPKKIYIFDDSFSKLDFATDYKLRKNLFKSLSDSIFLIVSQRVGTISKCDKIIVLDDGKIVAEGAHGELLRECALYHGIAKMQLGARIDE